LGIMRTRGAMCGEIFIVCQLDEASGRLEQ
jgi:hypothetical protein